MAQASEETTNGQGSLGPVAKLRRLAELRNLASDLLSRARFAGQAGQTYGGKRDVYCTLGYKESLGVEDYRSRYRRGGVARRILRAYPDATWVHGAIVQDDPDPDTETEFQIAVDEVFSRLDVWERLRRADLLTGMGRYGAILIGAPGDFKDPLPNQLTADEILYLTSLPEDRAVIKSHVKDSEDERFGMPEAYELRLTGLDDRQGADSINKLTHWSRIIHVVQDPLEGDLYGEPMLSAVFNYLEDLDKLVGGGSEAAWRRMDPGINLDIDPSKFGDEIPVSALEDMDDEVDEYIHGLSRVVKTVGAELKPLNASVSTFGPNTDTVLKLISGTTGIPVRILTGSERGELASSQDQENFGARVSERRFDFATPLVRQLVDRLMGVGALPEVEQYDVLWPEGEESSEEDKASVAGKLASANQAQSNAEGMILISSDEIRERVFGLEPLEIEMPEPQPDPFEDPDDEDGEDPEAEGRQAVTQRESQWAALQRVVNAEVPSFQSLITSSFKGEQIGSELEDALEARNDAKVGDLVVAAVEAAGRELQEPVEEQLLDAMEAGAGVAQRRTDSRRRAAQLQTSFDSTNPRAARIARQRAANLVEEVASGVAMRSEVRIALRELIADGFESGVSIPKLARRIRKVVGLRGDQIRALVALADELRNAAAGTLITRFDAQPTVRLTPGFRARVPEGGLSAAQLEQRLNQYATMQLNSRAKLIARTEAARAANEGQRELWRQAQERGELPREIKRVYITAGDAAVRESHAAQEGLVVGIDEDFPIEPGVEPRCRCTQGIVEA